MDVLPELGQSCAGGKLFKLWTDGSRNTISCVWDTDSKDILSGIWLDWGAGFDEIGSMAFNGISTSLWAFFNAGSIEIIIS